MFLHFVVEFEKINKLLKCFLVAQMRMMVVDFQHSSGQGMKITTFNLLILIKSKIGCMLKIVKSFLIEKSFARCSTMKSF